MAASHGLAFPFLSVALLLVFSPAGATPGRATPGGSTPGGAASSYTAPCSTCKGPTWTWDIFPAFIHSSSLVGDGKGGLSASDIEIFARFPIATLEKWQGSADTPYLTEEQAWVRAATQIKAASPNTTVVVWLDSFRIYTANKQLNPDLKPSCTTGHFAPAEFLETGGRMDGKLNPKSVYLLKNATGQPAVEPWSGCHIMDHTQQAARDYWAQMCLNLTRSGVIDGCGADASWQTGLNGAQGEWGLTNAAQEAWSDGHQEMMRRTTSLLGDGVLLGKEAYEVGDYVNGALCEKCPAQEATILMLQNLTARAKTLGKRLIYECHGSGKMDEIAAFLIGAGEYHYYGMGGWKSQINASQGHWVDGIFGRKLGSPDEPQHDENTGMWTRKFASGTKVAFNTKTNKGSIEWGSN